MTAKDVHSLLDLFEAQHIHIWLDGGWAVDANLGTQTRRHGDVDIVIEQHDVPSAVATLESCGYAPVTRPDTRPWNFVLVDDAGRQIDFHVIVRDEEGRGVYGPPANGENYPAEALTGKGMIEGRAVDCITPAWLVQFHTEYVPDSTDWADVSALCERFDIPVPAEYRQFL
jgi:lincosamide nucleotidyltransferase A/C/D/E